jgi:UDP-GlcNAc:undecaprenyl-phosphate GlcNAc-1-phosphate transferase
MGNYYLNIMTTYIWIIGITNSFNLLDNMNGLSAGIAIISAAFFGILAYLSGQSDVAAISLALAGSSLGFLRYNFPKATLFMGDSGSLVIGYILSVLAIMSGWKSAAITTFTAIPFLVLGYPIFDTAMVSVMRLSEGRSIFQGGKDHSSHRLALLGLKRYRTVLVIYGICISLGLVAVIVSRADLVICIGLIALASIMMVALGVRLSFVATKSCGRKKGHNGID